MFKSSLKISSCFLSSTSLRRMRKHLTKNENKVRQQNIEKKKILPDSVARQRLLGTLRMKDRLNRINKSGSNVNFCKLTACDKPIRHRRQGWSRGLHHGSQSYPRYAPRINTLKVLWGDQSIKSTVRYLLRCYSRTLRSVGGRCWTKSGAENQTLDLPTLMCSIRLTPVYPGRTKH